MTQTEKQQFKKAQATIHKSDREEPDFVPTSIFDTDDGNYQEAETVEAKVLIKPEQVERNGARFYQVRHFTKYDKEQGKLYCGIVPITSTLQDHETDILGDICDVVLNSDNTKYDLKIGNTILRPIGIPVLDTVIGSFEVAGHYVIELGKAGKNWVIELASGLKIRYQESTRTFYYDEKLDKELVGLMERAGVSCIPVR